jgi:hypothetical protein
MPSTCTPGVEISDGLVAAEVKADRGSRDAGQRSSHVSMAGKVLHRDAPRDQQRERQDRVDDDGNDRELREASADLLGSAATSY